MMTNEDHATGSGTTDTQPSRMETVLTTQTNEPQTDSMDDGINHLPSASVLVGGTVGAIAGSITYGGSNHWIRPLGLILAGLFLGIAETTDYPVVSTSSSFVVNMASEFVEIATESSTNFWSTLKSWLIDLLFFLTTAAFAMAGVWYAYLKIAEFLVAMTRRVLSGKSAQVTAEIPNTVTTCKATPVQPKKTPRPIVEDIVDSAATSGQSDDDLFPGKDTFPLGERCQSDRLFFGVEAVTPLSQVARMAKYRHVTNVTLGDQLRTQSGIRLHGEEKFQLCDSCLFNIEHLMKNNDVER